VYKAYIDEQTFAPAKPGQGIVVAVKKLNLEGSQGHREWLVIMCENHALVLSLLHVDGIAVIESFGGLSLCLHNLVFFANDKRNGVLSIRYSARFFAALSRDWRWDSSL
jgi:hypothetical protein